MRSPECQSTFALIPTQLIEASASLGIFLLLMLCWKRRVFRGQVVLPYLLLYSVERFVVEFWRDDPRGRIMNL
jgi:phosphatidylglycerol:prolipoprotein diacylglycerol transferase